MSVYHKHGTNQPWLSPQKSGCPTFLSGTALLCHPGALSPMCAQSRSCRPQSCVKITIIVVSLGSKRIISSPMILNVYCSHFNWFPRHRLPCNWSILCLWGAEYSFSFCHQARGNAWSVRTAGGKVITMHSCFVKVFLFNSVKTAWMRMVGIFPAFLTDAKYPLHCWFLIPL